MIDSDPIRKPKTDPALAAALEFTAEDLAANRDGVLSDAQREALRRKRRSFLLEGFGTFGVFGLVGLGLTVSLAAMFSQNGEPLLGFLLIGVFVTLGFFVFWKPTRDTIRQARGRWRDFEADLNKRGIGQVSGPVRLEIMRRGRYSSFRLFIAGYEFVVSSETLLAFKNGEPYHVYFTAHTLILLAAEPANDEPEETQ